MEQTAKIEPLRKSLRSRVDLALMFPARNGDDEFYIEIIKELEQRLVIARKAVACGKTLRDTFGGNIGGGTDAFALALDATDLSKPLPQPSRESGK